LHNDFSDPTYFAKDRIRAPVKGLLGIIKRTWKMRGTSNTNT